ncbi:MAG: NAD(P)-dependent oxidoreductase [Patescibacteria group bacterium]
MKVAITGAKGMVGRALIAQLDPAKFEVTPLDLPDHDASKLDDLIAVTAGSDALIHLAWDPLRDNFSTNDIDPINDLMLFNAYKAAIVNKIPRVIMASSNHAHRHDRRDTDGRIRASINPPIPDSPYGAEKVFMEALGRYYATSHNLEVICVRIGNVNTEDKPKSGSAEDPLRWLSHADLGRLITCCLETEKVPDKFQIVYGVSKQEVFDWSNPFGYEPLDSVA